MANVSSPAITRPPRDRDGRRLRIGDVVRVVGVPELKGMTEASRRDCLPVFRHLVGTYRTIAGFDALGYAEISFSIQRGPKQGLHWVTLEPYLLKRREERGTERGTERRTERRTERGTERRAGRRKSSDA